MFDYETEKENDAIFSERIRKVRKAVDKAVQEKKFNKGRRFIYSHLYGVAQSSALLAKKRGLSAELAVVAAMLHDISVLVYPDSKKHAHKSAEMAMSILIDLDVFSSVEIAIIYMAIYNHSDKDKESGVYDELLKDADVLQHALFDPLAEILPGEIKRYNRLIDELGFKEGHIEEPDVSELPEAAAAELMRETEEVSRTLAETNSSGKALDGAGDAIEAVAALAPLIGMENWESHRDDKTPADGFYCPGDDEEYTDMDALPARAGEMTAKEAAEAYSGDPGQFEAVIAEINRHIEKINSVNAAIDAGKKGKTAGNFVPAGLEVPEEYCTDTFYFCKLTPGLAQQDYEAVMEAKDEIRRIYGITSPDEWPNNSLTLEKNRKDSKHHEKEFDSRQAFAYSVFNVARKKCFGCFYITPCKKPEYDAYITLWGLNPAITEKLYEDVRKFTDEKFGFKNPAFPAFEIALGEWKDPVNPGVWK